MADYWALSAGNWSNISNWLTGTSPGARAGELPGPLDDVYANNRTVVIDVNPSIRLLTTATRPNVAAGGGGFVINNGVSLSANISAGTTTCLTFLSGFPNTCTIFGDVSGSLNTNSTYGVLNNSSGSITIFGNIYGGSGTASGLGAGNISTGNMLINGSCYSSRNVQHAHGLVCTNGTVTVSGNAFSGYTNSAAVHISNRGRVKIIGNLSFANWAGGNGYSVFNTDFGVLELTGNIVGFGQYSYGLQNRGRATATIYGIVSGGGTNGSGAIYNSSLGTITIYGDVYSTSIPGGGGFGIENVALNGTINIFGNVYGTMNNSQAVYHNGANTINITGDVFGGDLGNSYGVLSLSHGRVNINGTVRGGSGIDSYGVLNSGRGSVFINGAAVGGVGTRANGARNNSLGRVFVKTAVGNNFGISSVGIQSVPGVANVNIFGSCYVEELSAGIRGQFPTDGSNIYITRKSNNQATFLGAVSANPTTIATPTSSITMYSSLTGAPGTIAPLVSNVRSGIRYDFNSLTGTCVIPIPVTVLSGVVYDFDTVGTFFTNLERAWQTQLNQLSTQNTFGRRLRNIITLSAVSDTQNNIWTLSE
jgi:hypothetical protein